MLHKTAILIFARDASEEAGIKKVSPRGRESNFRILEILNQRTLRTARSTGLTTFISHRLGLDLNKSFGENFALTIQEVFSRGFEKVICIGNDCPAIGKSDLLAAATLLSSSDSVLGPDARGGAYLIGLSRNSFDPQSIKNLPWQSCDFFTGLLDIFSKEKIGILNVLEDINYQADLLHYASEQGFISRLIRFFVAKFHKIDTFFNVIIIQNILHARKFRGPPSLVS